MRLQFIRNVIISIYLLVIVVCFIINNDLTRIQSNRLLLFISIFNIVIYALILYYEFRETEDFHPFMLMLIASIQFAGFNGISVFNTISSGENIFFGIYDITDYITKGALFVSLEHLLIYLGFVIADKRIKPSNKITIIENLYKTNTNYFKWAINFYILVWFIRLIGLMIPISSISSILVNLTNQGQLLTLILLLFSYIKTNRKKYLYIHWLIVIIEISLVLSSGMKEVIIQNLIPYVIYLFIQYKVNKKIINIKFITTLSVIGIFVIFFIFPYVSLYRQINWTEGKNASVSEVFSEYINYIKGDSKYSTNSENRSIDYMMERAGSIEQNTFPIMYADKYGPTPKYLYYTLIAFVPRIVWQDKPPIRLGLMMHSLAIGKEDWENTNTSGAAFSIGFIGACYFTLGLWYAILMPFFMGYLITKLWYFYKLRIGSNLVALWGIFAIIAVINKDFEAFSDGGIAFCVWNFIYYLIIKIWENFNTLRR